jgi:curved DNA-binding protein CbpA
VLYVAHDAPPDVINAAFRALSKRLHPDASGDGAAMALIAAARDVLLDERQRAALDIRLEVATRSRAPAPPPAAAVLMPWGKYRGYELGTIPSDYLAWLASEAVSSGIRADAYDVLAWRRGSVR